MKKIEKKEYYDCSNFKDLMEQTFNAMPLVFTSRQFGRTARAAGVPNKIIAEGFVGRFLAAGGRVVKLSRFVYQKHNEGQVELNLNTSTEEQKAIKLLKGLGYKVMKQITEFKEL